ncbi:mediator-associated protein 2 isoform X3 [Magnolia sinica]|uniref:mediator-associated protein 2 isoform X3 n=1 Tax=Magnolia sinica TaxID=86752 RepID=UPI0026580841|nr:mediator-associated protein 2 isoform X3 [Magnolia sinica]
MDASKQGYEPPPEFLEVQKDPLVGISLTDSTELWLIQWPLNQLQSDDFEGKELSLKLHGDGQLASFESSSGKSYDVVSFAAQEPDATVLLPSGSESKVVGKISRRVCLVHYPEPGELEKPSRPSLSKLSAGSSRRGISELSTLERNERLRSSDMTTEISHGITTPSRSSKERSSVSGTSSLKGHSSKHSKRRQVDSPSPTEEPTRSADQSTRDSGWEGRSSISSFGNSDHSHEEKSKKKKKKMKVEE